MEVFPHPASRHDQPESAGVFSPSHSHTPLQEIRNWVHDVEEPGLPQFGEFALQPEDLREVILRGSRSPSDHSAICLCEDSHGDPDAQSHPPSGSGDKIRSVILQRLEDMMSALRAGECCFTTWQAAGVLRRFVS